MENLNFYTIPNSYAKYLQEAEIKKRGFTRVPNLDYGNSRKPKFLCGIVLKINAYNYFSPVTSYKLKKPDNFLICDKNSNVISSLRFNYMFPVPIGLIKERNIDSEPDKKYRALLAQELRYCIENQDQIRRMALRTYKKVIKGDYPGLVNNSCDFKFLEQKCSEYI